MTCENSSLNSKSNLSETLTVKDLGRKDMGK